MSNTFSVTDLVLKESQRIAHEEASFLKTVNNQYEDSYRNNGAGALGSTLRIRRPNRFTSTTSSRVMDVQDVTEATDTITIATQRHVDLRMNSQELTQSVESLNDVSERQIKPAIKQLIADIESEMLVQFTKDTPNVVGAGSYTLAGGYAPGTALTDLTAPGLARTRINQMAAPKSDRTVIVGSLHSATLTNGLKGLFQDSQQIREQYREGMLGRTAMADWYENEKIWSLPNAGDVATTLDTYTVVEGDTDITVAALSAAAVAGMVFTIAGVYDCHPETKQAYSHLKQFVVTSSTTTVVNFSPAIRLTGALKNVASSTGGTAAPATNAAVTFYGSASTNYDQNIMYHKDAFTFITADLPLKGGADKCSRSVEDKLSMRVWMDSDIRNDELLMRIDILYGFKTLRPEWACRISA